MKIYEVIDRIPLEGIKVVGNNSKEIEEPAEFYEADSSHISFAIRPKFIKDISKCKAGALIVREDFTDFETNPQIVYLVHKDPYLVWAYVLSIFEPKEEVKWEVDPTAKLASNVEITGKVRICSYAVISKGVKLEDGVQIGSQVFIGKDVVIGSGTKIYPQAVIREGSIIGKNCIIHSGVVIGSDGFGYVEDKYNKKVVKIPQRGIVKIGDDVEIGANTTVDRAVIGKTEIGDHTKIDNLVQIAHNVKIGKNCLIVSQVGISGSAKVSDNVKLAGQCGVVGHLTVGKGAIIAARSVVTSDIPEGGVYSGYPARPHIEEKRIKASLSRLPGVIRFINKLKKMDIVKRLLQEDEKTKS
jgi:UDP-3-O-[3-hydroxymyristoyl] glucosamine N-acyltransferase